MKLAVLVPIYHQDVAFEPLLINEMQGALSRPTLPSQENRARILDWNNERIHHAGTSLPLHVASVKIASTRDARLRTIDSNARLQTLDPD